MQTRHIDVHLAAPTQFDVFITRASIIAQPLENRNRRGAALVLLLTAGIVAAVGAGSGSRGLQAGSPAMAIAGERQDAPAAVRFEYTQIHMALPVRIVLFAEEEPDARRAAAAAFARIAALDSMMSDYRAGSELNLLSATAGQSTWVRTSPELFDVLHRAVEIARLTGGAFDPTIGPLVALWREARQSGRLPDAERLASARGAVGWEHVLVDTGREAVRLERPGIRLDLGGIAKGWILQEAARVLGEAGMTRLLVEAGGDIVVADAPPGMPGWRIEVPGAGQAIAARAAELTHAALATSGTSTQFVVIDGIRYGHIVDPRTGLGLTHDVTAHVIADHGATADALATALTVAGPAQAARLLAKLEGVIGSVQ
jgi:FAD:protein FMN transferase